MPLPRSVERMAYDQAQSVERFCLRPQSTSHRPVIALSRLPGAGGDELARELARGLGYELYDQRLIHEIAVSSHRSDRVVATLDERARGLLAIWLTDLLATERFGPHDYRAHLSTVVGALARRGGAVIVGRGAHLIVDPAVALRVLVVAPLALRVRRLAASSALSEPQALKVLEEEEHARREFLRANFQAELADPTTVDIVVNTASLGLHEAALVVRSALESLACRAAAGEDA